MDDMTFRHYVVSALRRVEQVQEETCGSRGKTLSASQIDEVCHIRSKLEAAEKAKVALVNELSRVRQEHQNEIMKKEDAHRQMVADHESSLQRLTKELQKSQQEGQQEFDKLCQRFDELQRHLDQCRYSLRYWHRFPPRRLSDGLKM